MRARDPVREYQEKFLFKEKPVQGIHKNGEEKIIHLQVLTFLRSEVIGSQPTTGTLIGLEPFFHVSSEQHSS
jgi:hypothetical protein